MKKNHIGFTLLLSFAFVLLLAVPQLNTVYADTAYSTELVANGSGESGISGWHDETGYSRWATASSGFEAPATAGSSFFFMKNGFPPGSTGTMSGAMSQTITLIGAEGGGLFQAIGNGTVSLLFSLDMYQSYGPENQVKAVLEERRADGSLIKSTDVVNLAADTNAMRNHKIVAQVDNETRAFTIRLYVDLTVQEAGQFDNISLKLINAASNSAPVLGDFPSAETNVGVTYGPAAFTVSDPDAGDISKLSFSATSTNFYLVPASNIIFSGDGSNPKITIIPAAGLSGETDITVTASDDSKSSSKTFHFTVHKVIAMDGNLVENGNGTGGITGWSGNTVNITGTGNGFRMLAPDCSMSQNVDISSFYALIDGGETPFNLKADFTSGKGKVSAQFYSDIACTKPIGGDYSVTASTPSVDNKVPANAKGAKITLTNTSGNYNEVIVRNIYFKIVNDFPKITPIVTQMTNFSDLTVPLRVHYLGTNPAITANSNALTIIANEKIKIEGTGINRSIIITPSGKNGEATITVSLTDKDKDGQDKTVTTSFLVKVLEPSVVTGVTQPASGVYAAGSGFDFTVGFSHDITGGTASRLPLSIGGKTVYASFLSQTANSITYRYTVVAGDAGIVAVGSNIDDSTSNITDIGGYDAETAIGAVSSGIEVVQGPAVSSSATGNQSVYGDQIRFTATLNCSQTLNGTIQFKINGIDSGSPVSLNGNQAVYETGEKELNSGSVTISAIFVPSDAKVKFASLPGSGLNFTVHKKDVSIMGLSVVPKTYDGTTSVLITGGAISGIETGDILTANMPTTGSAVNKLPGTQDVLFDPITLSGTHAGNYNLPSQPDLKAVISPKPVTPSAVALNKVYDGTASTLIQFTFAPDDIISGDTVTLSAIGQFSDANAGTGKTVTLAGLTTAGSDKSSYVFHLPAELTADISPLDIQITPDPLTKIYGKADPSMTYMVTAGHVAGSETLKGNLTRAAGETAGTYAIMQGTIVNANNPNYNITFASGNVLTITKETPVITVSSDKTVQKTGRDVIVSATLNYPNKQATDAYPATITFTAINAAAKGTVTVNGNIYRQTFTIGADLTTSAAFYAEAPEGTNYSGAISASPVLVAIIDRYTPEISVDSDKSSDRSTYGDSVVFEASVSDGSGTPKGTVQFYIDSVALGDKVALTPQGAASITASTQLTAGSRSITAQYEPALDELDYKTATSSSYGFHVDQKPVSIVGLAAIPKIYDGKTQVSLTGGAINGVLNGASVSANIPVKGTVSTKIAEDGKSVSFDQIILSGADKDNYILSAQPVVTAAIAPKAITASAVVADKNYDGTTSAAVTLSFLSSDLIGTDQLTATVQGSFLDRNAGTAKTVTLGGVVTGGSDRNNYIVNPPVNLTAAIHAVGVEITPDSASKEYGQADPGFTYQITGGHLVSGETLNGLLSRTSGENTGTYMITQGSVTNTGNPNYEIQFVSGAALTILKTAPTVVVSSNKASGSAIYGESITFKAVVSGPGVVPVGKIQFSLSGPAIELDLVNGTASLTTSGSLTVGTKSVTASYIPSSAEKNYKSNDSAAYDFTIHKKEITVKAEDKTIYVGDPIPADNTLTFSKVGFVGADSLLNLPTLSLPANATSSAVTTYAISVTGATAGDNYTVKMVDGTLNIIARPTGGGSPKPNLQNTAPPVTIPEKKTVSVTTNTTATVTQGGNATASVTENQLNQAVASVLSAAAANGDDTIAIVEIKVNGANNAGSVTTNIPQTAFHSLTNSETDGLRINTPVGSIDFDGLALSTIDKNIAGDINMKIETLDQSTLTNEAKSIVGDRPVYDFTVSSGNGRISNFGEGTAKLTVPYTLKEGEDPNKVIIYYMSDSGDLVIVPDCIYDPDTRTATFVTKHFSVYALGYNGVSFKDSKGWYADYVDYLGAREIIKGTSKDKFSPQNSITRAQFVTILANMAGADVSKFGTASFSDISAGTWYSGAVQWAFENGIAKGAGGKFDPNGSISREQMAVMIRQYAKLSGDQRNKATAAAGDGFKDSENISGWAKEAVNWGVTYGIITGDHGTFKPKSGATRAEAAKMITIFLKGTLQ